MNDLATFSLRLLYALFALAYLFALVFALSLLIALAAVMLHQLGLLRLPGVQFGEFGVRIIDEDELRKAGL